MKSNEERHHVDDDQPVSSTKSTCATSPKLRKNKRLEKRWGQKYYTIVKEAVFTVRETPYMPAEPSFAIREEADDCQPLYVCKQCRDCFRFLSSLEAHNSRRSWILGYWCHNCFFVDCSHTQKGQPPCFECQAINRERTTFLRAKGLRKGRKMGCIKIFYNQCQFFSHLRGHDTIVVDMGDIMLMPMPMDVDRECYAELEKLCETIMERMFLTRTHIMDWLRLQQLDNKWSRLLQSSSENIANSLPKIIRTPKGTRRGKNSVKLPIKLQKTTTTGPASPVSSSVTCPTSSDTASSISETIESVVAQSTCDEPTESKTPQMPPLSSITYINPLEPIEDDDNPCTTADIAFVDCGPAAKTYPSELAIVLAAEGKPRMIQNGSKSCNSVVKVSGAPLILKKRQVDNGVHATLSSTASPASPRPLEPKISVKKFANERLRTSSVVPCIKNHSNANLQRSQTQTLRKLAPAPNSRVIAPKKSIQSVTGISRAIESSKKAVGQTSLTTLGSKILTVHSQKNADLSKIISQLPPDVINGKKIVFIGQDAERFTILPKTDTTTPSSGMIKVQSDIEKGKTIQTLPTKKAPMLVPNIGGEQSLRIAPETSKKNPLMDRIRPTIQQVYLDGKVIYQNGKKFIIRHARKPIPESTVCTNLSNLKLQTIPKRVSLSSFLSNSRLPVTSCMPLAAKSIDTGANKVAFPLTLSPAPSSPSPSSSPSSSLSPSTSTFEHLTGLKSKVQIKRNGKDWENVEKSADSPNCTGSQSTTATTLGSPSSRDVPTFDAVEYFSIKTNADGKSYVDFSKTKEPRCTQTTVNYKQQMLEHFRRLGAGRIKQHIDHLMEVNAEYSKMLDVSDDPRISENLKVIKELENATKENAPCSDRDQGSDQESSVEDINEILLSLQEIRKSSTVCPTCNRSTKSEAHILEFSKGSAESPGCRSCNSYVCHICNVFQGNMSRFRAHLNYHAKREPFTCPECFKKFPTFHKLQNHTWTTCFHSLSRRWLECKVCQVEGFLNMESVTKHFILAHSKLRIACPECRILLKSRGALKQHQKEVHPKATDSLEPVNLMICDIGNCVVRLEDYRSHMDHHTAVAIMLYYKCSFCPFLIKAIKPGRERMKSHLYNKHQDKLSGIVSFENVPLDWVQQSLASDDHSQTDQNPDICDVSMSNLCSDKNDQGKEVIESERGSYLPESVQKNSEGIILGSIEHTSDYLDATLTKPTLTDRVQCSIWSMNLDHTKSPHSTDLGPDSLEVTKTANSNHVITEYSSSPKIFDVRSVTPDSYAELDEVTKEQVDTLQSFPGISKEKDSESFVAVKILEKPDQIVVSEGGTKESLLIRMGEQLLPMKLPQVIVINQAEGSINLTEILQSKFTASNTLVKVSDLAESTDKLETETTDEKTDSPQTKDTAMPVIKTVRTLACSSRSEERKKVAISSTTVTKLPESVQVWPKQSSGGKKQIIPLSVLKSQNSSIQEIRTDIDQVNYHMSDSHPKVANSSQINKNTSGHCEESTKHSLFSEVSKPPPLARIPQRLLEVSQVNDEVGEEEPLESNVTTPRSLTKLRQKRKRPWRIALNAPISTTEVIKYHCHLCGDLIDTSGSVIRDHFNSRHSQDYKLSIVTPRLLRMSSDFIAEGYKEVLGSRKRKSDPSLSSSKRRRRWNPKKHIDKHALGPGLCVQQESVQDGEGNFVCRKCDHQCNDISSLRIHIGTNHRIKDHYLVCLECGENFVVEPSLQMHLKAFHRIQDPCAYMAQNTAYIKEITETVDEESNTGIANQCHVCMAVFEDKLAVDKHLRVHGMAFLNRKRIEAQNAARNPEKKSKIDNPDDSMTPAGQKNEKLENRKLGKIDSVNGTVRES